jgi:hypothetical protein
MLVKRRFRLDSLANTLLDSMPPQHEPPVACGDVVEDVRNFPDTRGTQLCTNPDSLPALCFLVANFLPE